MPGSGRFGNAAAAAAAAEAAAAAAAAPRPREGGVVGLANPLPPLAEVGGGG